MAIIYPNIRGSSGFGKTYEHLDDGRNREDAVKDIGALLDWIGAASGVRQEPRDDHRCQLWRLHHVCLGHCLRGSASDARSRVLA